MADKGPVDEKLKQAITDIEAQQYKVLTKEEYEHLMTLNVSRAKVGTDASQVLKAPTPNTSTPQVTKAPTVVQPNLNFAFPGFSPVPRLQHLGNSQLQNSSYMASPYNVPKLPFFSGSEEPQKGETSYEVWNLEVKCLQKSYLPDHILLQSIRNSLKGSARSMLVPLGENASVDDILNKLDGFYGNVCSSETLIQSFYSDYQKDSESIVAYGSRLEQTLSRAIRYGHIDLVAKDAMLRSKFWTGLKSVQLKHSTRHLYDSIKDFQSLLKEVRKVEQEENSVYRPPATAAKQKVAQQQAGQASSEADDTNSQLLKQMTELMSRMKAMEQKLDVQQQTIAAANSQASTQMNSFQPQFSRGMGRGYGRGWRGGVGRGYQNYNRNSGSNNTSNSNTFQNNSRGGGNFRGGHRGGTSGRSANRGGTGTEGAGAQHLNF